MKFKISFVLIAILIANLLLSGVASAQIASTEIYVFPVTTETTTCSNMTFGIWVKNVVDLTAFHLEINFDPGSVEVTKVENGGFLGTPIETALFEPTNSPIEVINSTGKILFGVAQQGTNGDPLPKSIGSEGGKLLEITLKAKTPGNLVPFTIDGENSILVNWPDAFRIPFTVTGPGVVSTSSCAPTDITLSPNTVADGMPAGTEVGTLLTIDSDSSLPWGDSWTYYLLDSQVDNAQFAISGNKLVTRFTANYGTSKTYTIKVRSTDAGGKFIDKSLTITVNRAPIIDPIPEQSATVGTPLTFTATASDADLPPATLTFSLKNDPAGAVIDPTTGDFSWTPTEDQGGKGFTFKVCVSDGATTTCQEITIKVVVATLKLYLPLIFR